VLYVGYFLLMTAVDVKEGRQKRCAV
jgi:hypothetical protein